MPGPGERVLFPIPAATARGGVVLAPSQLVLDGTENLQITSWNSATGVVLGIEVRAVTADGSVQITSAQHTPNTDRSAATLELALGSCVLLGVTVSPLSGTPLRGQTFVRVDIIRGYSGGTIAVSTILQGYVAGSQARSWPGSPIEDSLTGRGWSRSSAGSAPAAGVETQITMPAGASARLVAYQAVLTAGASAGTRHAQLVLTRAVGDSLSMPNTTSLAGAGRVNTCTWLTAGANSSATFTDNTTYIITAIATDLILNAGDVLKTKTDGFQPDDQWGAPIVTLEEWLQAAA